MARRPFACTTSTHRRGRRAVEVVDGDVGAFLGEHFRDAPADATARARDERHFACEFQGALPRSPPFRLTTYDRNV